MLLVLKTGAKNMKTKTFSHRIILILKAIMGDSIFIVVAKRIE